jgi:hypothetical protein
MSVAGTRTTSSKNTAAVNVSNWTSLRELGPRIDSAVERRFERCLDRDFQGGMFPPDIGGISVDPAAATRYLSRPDGVERAYVVAWIRVAHVGDRSVASLLDWFKRFDGPVWVVPDTIASAGPETLDGIPFVEIIAEVDLDAQRDGQMLVLIAGEWLQPHSPDVWFVIPDAAVLHPLRSAVEVVPAAR